MASLQDILRTIGTKNYNLQPEQPIMPATPNIEPQPVQQPNIQYKYDVSGRPVINPKLQELQENLLLEQLSAQKPQKQASITDIFTMAKEGGQKKGFLGAVGGGLKGLLSALADPATLQIGGAIAAMSGNPYVGSAVAQRGDIMKQQQAQQQAQQQTIQTEQQKMLQNYIENLREQQTKYDELKAKNVIGALGEVPKGYTVEFNEKGEQVLKKAPLGGIDDEQFKRENALRDEYVKSLGDFPKVRDSFLRINASVKDPSAAGDLALIFNYMKMLDPGSTVREGEFATAQNSASIPEIIRAKYNKLLQGERLSAETRQDFYKRSKMLFDTAENQTKTIKSTYSNLAKNYNVDPNRVIIDLSVNPEDLKDLKSTTNQIQNIKNFKSEAEVNKANLPKGTIITINGKKAVIE